MSIISKFESANSFIQDAITTEVEKRIREATHLAIENAKLELQNNIAQITAGITLEIYKMMDVEMVADKLVITVKIPKDKK